MTTLLPAGPEAVPFEPDPTVPLAKGGDEHPAVRQLEKAGRYERARIAFARDLFDRHTPAQLFEPALAILPAKHSR
ncbi:hypothetical protein [Amycolatopsis sp. NBC_00438]|uniref:hypothetical protein n=1 Tax=Amycolatopsis sp. NBC_00438 TaxID=2903558 RepID=UPI002E1DFEB8